MRRLLRLALPLLLLGSCRLYFTGLKSRTPTDLRPQIVNRHSSIVNLSRLWRQRAADHWPGAVGVSPR